ncbi:hypothetical protein GCM10010149_53730 [Nonomuraea roseoviolacea subsp. roseoviolacea]
MPPPDPIIVQDGRGKAGLTCAGSAPPRTIRTSGSCATQGPRRSLARLHVNRWVSPRQVRPSKKWGHTVKKLVVLALVALGGLLIWRKVQADRAELDLWTEATGSEN